MRKKTSFTILALFCMTLLLLSGCNTLDLDKGTVTGTITDHFLGTGVQGAIVSVGDVAFKTDSTGTYTLQVVPGEHILKVIKPGYRSIETTVTVVKGKTTTFNTGFFDVSDSTGTIRGIVTDGRGGPAVPGVTISVPGVEEYATITDANGEFQLEVKAGYDFELLIEAENRATMRIQAVQANTANDLYIEIPTRGIFNPNPNWSDVPPTISLDIAPGTVLSGDVEINVTVEGPHPTDLIYAYLGGEHRSPRDGFFLYTDTGTVSIDTTAHRNGDTYLKVLVYDVNENGAIYIIPVTIDNPIYTTEVPSPLTYLEVIAESYGQNICFYSKGNHRLSKEFADTKHVKDLDNVIEAAPEGATIMVTVAWDPVEDADGYRIYRKFSGETKYSLYSELNSTYIMDFSAQLAVNRPVSYKVIPFNSAGEGKEMVRTVTPLPAYNIYLESPANDTKGVELKPTFTWKRDTSSAFPEGTYFESTLTIYDGTDYIEWAGLVQGDVNCTFDLPVELAPNYVYTWDIMSSWAGVMYEYDEAGKSMALSFAGEFDKPNDGTGSVNGEFIFTTTSKVSE